ncbi:MAG: rhodanese-like domain-containing protein [Saprospiraceae bacterium]
MEVQLKAKEICPTSAQKWIAEGALMVDVRERDEVEALAYDVPNLLHIPLSEFEDRYREIPQDRQVVVACKGGGRSLRATYFLINNGYDSERVVNMQHGIIRWVQRGFPTKGDPSTVLDDQGGGCCSKANCC